MLLFIVPLVQQQERHPDAVKIVGASPTRDTRLFFENRSQP